MPLPPPPLTPPAIVERVARLEQRVEEVFESLSARMGGLETAEVQFERRHTELVTRLATIETGQNNLRLGQQRTNELLERVAKRLEVEVAP